MLIRIILLGLTLLGGLLVAWAAPGLPTAQAVPSPIPTAAGAAAYEGRPMSNKPEPKFNYSKLMMATPGSPLNLPPPSAPAAGQTVPDGALVALPAAPPATHVRTDGELRAEVEKQLQRVTRRGPATIRYLGVPGGDFFDRYNLAVREPTQTVVAIVECDCDASALLPHTENVKWLIWVMHRQHGARVMASEGSPMVQELLGDPAIPLPAHDRLRAQTGIDPPRGRPGSPGRPAPTPPVPGPLLPPPAPPFAH